MSIITYTFEKLRDASREIAKQYERFSDYDRQFITDVISDLQGFQSNFAKEMAELLDGMELDNTAFSTALYNYSVALVNAHDNMYELETAMTAKLQGGEQ